MYTLGDYILVITALLAAVILSILIIHIEKKRRASRQHYNYLKQGRNENEEPQEKTTEIELQKEAYRSDEESEYLKSFLDSNMKDLQPLSLLDVLRNENSEDYDEYLKLLKEGKPIIDEKKYNMKEVCKARIILETYMNSNATVICKSDSNYNYLKSCSPKGLPFYLDSVSVERGLQRERGKMFGSGDDIQYTFVNYNSPELPQWYNYLPNWSDFFFGLTKEEVMRIRIDPLFIPDVKILAELKEINNPLSSYARVYLKLAGPEEKIEFSHEDLLKGKNYAIDLLKKAGLPDELVAMEVNGAYIRACFKNYEEYVYNVSPVNGKH